MTIVYIGVDPGLSGAIACYDPSRNFIRAELRVEDMPTVEVKRGKSLKRELNMAALADILYGFDAGSPHAFVEQVGAMPGQGVTSMFSFGKSYGAVLGALAALEIPVTHVTPQRWKKALSVRPGKDAARLRASELLPEHSNTWKLKKHDGRAEAAMIAYYGATKGI